jgi:hypothetical protein
MRSNSEGSSGLWSKESSLNLKESDEISEFIEGYEGFLEDRRMARESPMLAVKRWSPKSKQRTVVPILVNI